MTTDIFKLKSVNQRMNAVSTLKMKISNNSKINFKHFYGNNGRNGVSVQNHALAAVACNNLRV